MRSWICGGALLVLMAQFAGCGSVQSTQKIRVAQERIDTDDFDSASKHSVYESILAETYLEKARKEWSKSDWQHAVRYAAEADSWAERAIERAATRGPVTGVDE